MSKQFEREYWSGKHYSVVADTINHYLFLAPNKNGHTIDEILECYPEAEADDWIMCEHTTQWIEVDGKVVNGLTGEEVKPGTPLWALYCLTKGWCPLDKE